MAFLQVVKQLTKYLRQCRLCGEEDLDLDLEPVLEEELDSFMKTLRLPNRVGKLLPRPLSAQVPPFPPPREDWVTVMVLLRED